jgi:glyceraldehyde-3-phosphate dehydrogenase (NADP+)
MSAQPRPFLVDGQWLRSPQVLEVTDPFTGERHGATYVADGARLERAIDAAHRALAHTRAMPGGRRAEILRGAAARIEARRGELVDVMIAEVGKPRTLADGEVSRCVWTLTDAADVAERIDEPTPLDAGRFPSGTGHSASVRRFPVGVVYGITPFNFPLNLVAHKVAPAVAAGCPIVVKPTPRSPTPALILAEALLESAAVPGQVQVVPVVSNDLAQKPLEDPRVAMVSFTGSAFVGWEIKRKGWKRRVALELGGNAAVIVHHDADLGLAVPAIANGAFAWAGQSCISLQRVLVHERIYAAFRDALLDYTSREIAHGDPRDPAVTVGPLIDAQAMRRVLHWVNDAKRSGARALCGGVSEGPVMRATLLEDVAPTCEAWAEEIFGPVACLASFADFDDALARVNQSRYGLQAGVYTRDDALIGRAFAALEVGAIAANQVPTFRLENQPYGGVKDSGVGREGAAAAVAEMTEPRVLIVRDLP